VCDKGGECPLQDYSYTFGPAGSRMEFPRRTFDGNGVGADVDFGPTLMLNRNRCIMCTRCVRVMKEIDNDAQLGVVDRGVRSQLSTFEERGVHSLLSGNLMDVCPVGAITTRDYQFKSRPWDNPLAVDTTCTLCSKGCSTTAWLKAKPEWAKGARLIRFTPRYNPDVNGYWMCDIGRFQYHWVEGDARLTTPLLRQEAGPQVKSTWGGALARVREALLPVAKEQAAAFRMLVSAHASHEELFLVRQLVSQMAGATLSSAVAVAWRTSAKAQPGGTKFKVPAVDAPNLAGARAMGFRVPEGAEAECDLTGLRKEVESGAVKALYVVDPGPEGSIGDVQWVIEARASGALPLLVVQGVVMTPLAAAADIVLPGAAWVEKEATYTNDGGLLQATARVMAPPGDAHEDWRVLADVATAAGITTSYADARAVRAALGAAMSGVPAFGGIAAVAFPRPLAAKTWLQASNPSERWKWDHMFNDLPPVKGFPVLTRAQDTSEDRSQKE
jgi:NADH-quinone oxidoreductase subunit G